MHRTALFSPCRTFRYRLGRRWSDGSALAFVQLNPSTANETADDQTVRRCIHFAQRDGYGGLEGVNLYAYVSTDPEDLRRAGYPVGPGNDLHIAAAARECDRVVLAWGARTQCRRRAEEVLELLHGLGVVAPHCFRVTRRPPGASAQTAGELRAAVVPGD